MGKGKSLARSSMSICIICEHEPLGGWPTGWGMGRVQKQVGRVKTHIEAMVGYAEEMGCVSG